MTQNTSKKQPLEDFKKVITPEACSQLASLTVAHQLVLRVIEEGADTAGSTSILKEIKDLMSEVSPLAVVSVFHNPSSASGVFTSKEFKKFSSEAPDLYALCQTPEAQLLSASDVYNELCYGSGHVATLTDLFLEEYEKEFSDAPAPKSKLIN